MTREMTKSQKVWAVRQNTGAPMLKIRKALELNDWDVDRAIYAIANDFWDLIK